MRIGIIGSGNIGGNAARLFVSAGHEVAICHSGPTDTLAGLVKKLGPRSRAMTVDEAVRFGEVTLLALPWRNRESLPADAFAGKIVIDATNPYAPDFSVYDLGDSTSSEEVQKTLPKARIVKAFNTLFARDLASRGNPNLPIDQRTAIFVAGDDDQANGVVAGLIGQIGFVPVFTGGLHEGGRIQQPGSPIYTEVLTGREAVAALGLSPDAVFGEEEATQQAPQ